MTFTDLGLSDDILRAIADVGYSTPTPIQEQAIPVALTGRDILGCAQTGTGKTASFTLPMIDILSRGRAKARMPRSLIVEPTRELAAQVSENFELYGKYSKLSMALLIGGERFGDQERALERGVDVLVATPGRLIDMFERGKILLNDVKVLVIDEADRMLDMGFIPDIEFIVSKLPPIRQTLFFSATMPPEIRKLADRFLMNPKEISVAPPASPAETVEQAKTVVPEKDKRDALRILLGAEDVTNAIIFCNRKRDVDLLEKSLKRHGFDAAALHGDMAQFQRTQTLDRFREGDVKILVASDVAARGLDIVRVSHVFNYDVPIHADDYIHRIGRTGRAGRRGKSIMIATPKDGVYVDAIEKMLGRTIPMVEHAEIATAELEAGDGKARRGRRGGSRAKGTAGAGEAPTPVERPVVQPAEQPVEQPAEKPARARRSSRKAKPAEEAAPVASAAPANDDTRPAARRSHNGRGDSAEPRRRHRGGDEERDETPVGFGDDVPAFLRQQAAGGR
jgi:superfamily II DNA/RNA helicase